MKKITSFWQMLALNTYWVGLSFKWNALHPIILPALLLNYVPDAQKNTWLGTLTFIGLILATIVQPLSGALSDGWVSRWGRRRPLIVIGTLFDFIFLAILAWGGGASTGSARGLVGIFIGYIGLQISSNTAHGPAQGLLPDRVAPEKVGQASGLKTFMDMAALIIASLAAGNLLDAQGKNPTLIVLVVMGVMLVATLIPSSMSDGSIGLYRYDIAAGAWNKLVDLTQKTKGGVFAGGEIDSQGRIYFAHFGDEGGGWVHLMQIDVNNLKP